MGKTRETASIIFAAGKGSRMKDFDGNKTLLPLIAGRSPFEGHRPILLHILDSLPPGPKSLIVNHKKDEVIESTLSYNPRYYEQPVLNGTGGALLTARDFIEKQDYDQLIITMGDVPFVKTSTYNNLLEELDRYNMVVLGFRPSDKKKYGVLDIVDGYVKSIIEWKYWKDYPEEQKEALDICNSGIYAARRMDLLRHLRTLERRPHIVHKERNGEIVEIEEFFITDLIELMQSNGLKIGCIVAEREDEVMGIDDLSALEAAQKIYKEKD